LTAKSLYIPSWKLEDQQYPKGKGRNWNQGKLETGTINRGGGDSGGGGGTRGAGGDSSSSSSSNTKEFLRPENKKKQIYAH
jgi:hypothetical protein